MPVTNQDSKQLRAPTVPGTAKTGRSAACCPLDRFIGPADFRLQPVVVVKVQPRLVFIGVVAEFVPGIGNLPQGGVIFLIICIHTDYEEGQVDIEAIENFEHVGNEYIIVRRPGFPSIAAMSLHIGPQVVEVQGNTRRHFLRHDLPCP